MCFHYHMQSPSFLGKADVKSLIGSASLPRVKEPRPPSTEGSGGSPSTGSPSTSPTKLHRAFFAAKAQVRAINLNPRTMHQTLYKQKGFQ